MKEFLIIVLLYIPSTLFLMPVMANMLLSDYNYDRNKWKYPFKFRARTCFIIGLILFIIPIIFIK